MSQKQIDLVIAGGGSHIVGLAGAAFTLAGHRDVVRVGGASAGAIMAAAFAIGLDESAVKKLLGKFLGGGLLDLSLWPPHRFGLYKGDALERALKQTFGEMRMNDAHIPLRVVVCDLYERRPLIVSSDKDEHKKLKIVDVLRCSSAIPGFFRAHTLPEVFGNRLFVDGGVAANFNMGMFDDHPHRKTVGVRLFQDVIGKPEPVRSVGAFAVAMAELLTWSSNNAHVSTKRWQDVIQVVTHGSGLDFSLAPEAQERRWASGVDAAQRWIYDGEKHA
jgi:predicted acylesterase/phospholipase RssA